MGVRQGMGRRTEDGSEGFRYKVVETHTWKPPRDTDRVRVRV